MKQPRGRRALWLALAALATIGLGGWAIAREGAGPNDGATASVKVKLAGAEEKVKVERGADGHPEFVITRDDGRRETLSPDDFASRLLTEEAGRGWWLRLFNITSPIGLAWVGLGLAGQLLFTGRMLLQWLASERERRSVVPVGFWWLSVAGSTLLVAYFLWRKDLVGVLGQGAGWVIYLRNLWLIYRSEGGLADSQA
ncbi:MAG: lipid-A-disaccharide synthase N-terminal domain-containing protein [Thermoanaerobaculia bacterium]